MSAVHYWKGRLDAGRPLYCDAYWRSPGVWKPHMDEQNRPLARLWPRAVAKDMFYRDYLVWFEEVYLSTYRGVPYFELFPDRVPKPLNLLRFWREFRPMVITPDTRVYPIKAPRMVAFKGRWVEVFKTRTYVYLLSLREHREVYDRVVGKGGG